MKHKSLMWFEKNSFKESVFCNMCDILGKESWSLISLFFSCNFFSKQAIIYYWQMFSDGCSSQVLISLTIASLATYPWEQFLSMSWPLILDNNSKIASWQPFGSSMAICVHLLGSTLALPWEFYGSSLAAPWQFLGSSLSLAVPL